VLEGLGYKKHRRNQKLLQKFSGDVQKVIQHYEHKLRKNQQEM
jgi:hypothetical protein